MKRDIPRSIAKWLAFACVALLAAGARADDAKPALFPEKFAAMDAAVSLAISDGRCRLAGDKPKRGHGSEYCGSQHVALHEAGA